MNHSSFRFNLRVRPAILAGLFASLLAMAATPCEADAPPNDNLANAQAIPTDSFSVSGTMVGATIESFEYSYEPAFTYGTDLTASVWYTWTPSVSGELTAGGSDTSGSGHNTPVLLFEGPGTPSKDTFVDSNSPTSASFTTNVTGGQPYYICVALEAQYAHSFALVGTLKAQSTPTPTPTSQPSVTLVVKTPKVSRSSGAIGKVFIELSSAATTDLTVAYKMSGTAVERHRLQNAERQCDHPTGATKATLKIKPLTGSADRLSLKLTLAAGDGYTVGNAAKGKVKIVD